MKIGTVKTSVDSVTQVATKLNRSDIFGAIKVRWMIGRDNYQVDPGLYAVGDTDDTSDVFVTANYKLSFDHVRKNLDGINAWVLVLDTKGINVWCAAGKGTFGTTELVNRIKSTQLDKIVSHRRIIVPQLGATGISAHQVKALTSAGTQEKFIKVGASPVNLSNISSGLKINQGFNVVYGPVRASDIKEFIKNGYKSTSEMRKVTFNFSDRIKLAPVDLVYARYKLLFAFAIIFTLAGLNNKGISLKQAIDIGLPAMLNIALAYLTGIVVTPILLPYIPVRMFAFKGLISGFILSVVLLYFKTLGQSPFEIIAWFLMISSISSFMAMNFTGASTFTSLSGVKKEMRAFVPVQILFAGIGLILFVLGNLKMG
jgi:hypothetical protein